MKFTPKKIEVNQIAYTKAVKDAEEKLNNFKEEAQANTINRNNKRGNAR